MKHKEVYMHVKDRHRLAEAIACQKLSHRRLARAVGWRSHTTVGRLVRGQQQTLDVYSAIKAAQILGVPIDDIFYPEWPFEEAILSVAEGRCKCNATTQNS